MIQQENEAYMETVVVIYDRALAGRGGMARTIFEQSYSGNNGSHSLQTRNHFSVMFRDVTELPLWTHVIREVSHTSGYCLVRSEVRSTIFSGHGLRLM